MRRTIRAPSIKRVSTRYVRSRIPPIMSQLNRDPACAEATGPPSAGLTYAQEHAVRHLRSVDHTLEPGTSALREFHLFVSLDRHTASTEVAPGT